MLDLTQHQQNVIIALPRQTGTYALHLSLSHPQWAKIGKLGEFNFPPGDYLYIGSALGPGGLQARLSHHLRGESRHHWHIDWLRAITDVVGFYYLTSSLQNECLWSQALMDYPGASVPAPRFGASDCRNSGKLCSAHLVRFESGMHTDRVKKHLSEISGSDVIYRRFTSIS
jgi:Uri superfamily endonuclease